MQDKKEKIKEILEESNATLGYVFGSVARGTEGPLSDIDVAVALPFDFSEERQEEEIEEIRNKLQKVFNTDYVDAINLNKNKSILLGHRIIFSGIPLVIRDSKLKYALESKYLHDYENTRHIRFDQFKILKEYYVSH